MTSSSPLQTQLGRLFDQRNFQAILDQAQRDEISPANDPQAANVVAAALFQLGRYSDCLLWCEGLQPALQGDISFSSMYGAVLRRVNRLDEAETIFRSALEQHPDNPYLLNNFANLLIDRQAFAEAEAILQDLLTANPGYEDARVNLNRLQFQKNLTVSVPKTALQASNNQPINVLPGEDNSFIDPLVAAFSDEEVALAGGINAAGESLQRTSSNSGLHLSNLPDRARAHELQETLALARQLIESDPQQAIRDCSLLQRKLGVQAPIYVVAGEAYIRLQLFADAEATLLVAHGLGIKDASVLLNLANLGAMRGDQRLALHWLELLAERQPDNPQLDSVRRTLFPQGAPSSSTNPFQVNLDQQSPGNFN